MCGCYNSAIKPQRASGETDEIFAAPLFSDGIHQQLMTQNSHIFPVESSGF